MKTMVDVSKNYEDFINGKKVFKNKGKAFADNIKIAANTTSKPVGSK